MVNNPVKTKYLLDTNILMGFSLWKPITLKLNDVFWSEFSDALEKDKWVLLNIIVDEIKYDKDLLKWCKKQVQKGIVKEIDDVDRSRAVGINNKYNMINQSTFKSTADTYLIAYAEANKLGIFSRESPRIKPTDLYKIPDVCKILNIHNLRTPKTFLKEIGFN
ncbi:DUF4411 family protein [Patescibacteria group bacterium]|nr:DUF4411 family protein [Patescibacteria group bacterium]MBU4580685.1 DUF4411 family protein [Patescibacteria group bacterium]